MNNIKKKLSRIKKTLKKNNAQQALIKSNDPLFFWIFQKDVKKAILIIKENKNILITKSLEYTDKEFQKNNLEIITINKSSEIKDLAKKIIKGTTLINYNLMTMRDIEDLDLKKTIDYDEESQEIRQVKNDVEIQKIKTACNHTIKCWREIIQKIKQKELKTEKQILKHIKKYALKNDLELAFNPVVASGENAGVPHHEPQNTLKKGFLVIDLGFSYKGYKSDMTRTIYLGEPTKQEKQIYEELLRIQEEMIQRTTPRKKASKLYDETLKLMKTPELFIHGLGHGVGVEIHEKPSILENTKDTIKKNQVLTIEPGYYTNKYGIRIEDTILVDETNKILTRKASKKLKIIR